MFDNSVTELDSRCVVCKKKLTLRVWSEYRGDPMFLIMGPGSKNQMSTMQAIECSSCGLQYRNEPKKPEEQCVSCDSSIPHTEHQLCRVCCKKVAVPEGVLAFTNSTVCKQCEGVESGIRSFATLDLHKATQKSELELENEKLRKENEELRRGDRQFLEVIAQLERLVMSDEYPDDERYSHNIVHEIRNKLLMLHEELNTYVSSCEYWSDRSRRDHAWAHFWKHATRFYRAKYQQILRDVMGHPAPKRSPLAIVASVPKITAEDARRLTEEGRSLRSTLHDVIQRMRGVSEEMIRYKKERIK